MCLYEDVHILTLFYYGIIISAGGLNADIDHNN